jgi:eukaryotic-like serine/threonine-protein kinase
MNVDQNQAKSIYLNASEIAAGAERAAYVDAECKGNEALRREVEELLKHHGPAKAFLEPAVPAPAGTLEQPASTIAGSIIGPYKLLQQIGEGGMGVVWMAEQTQPVQRKVALKVIKPGMDSRQVIARFEAERQALAMMDHVNIARVLDAGTTDNGRPYFVMELVHGVPITKYCDDNHLTPRERLELFVPVCQAIQHAHQKGIIHRDIKPSNVMVTLYDGKPVPKVIDFGVAKATEQKLTERTLFTQYGAMVGTLEYMSPEQAEMSALGVDTRSDIYSLGVLLYELLTGSTPLTNKRMKEAAYAEILRMIKEEEPPKPSTRLSDSGEALASISANRHMEPAKLTKLVRGELDWIVMKTLEKDRNQRYETANGLAMDVLCYLNDEQVQACPPSAWYRLRKFVRRNKAAVGVSGVIAASLALTVGALLLANDALAAKQAETQRAKEQIADALSELTKALAEKTTALAEKSTALLDLKNAHESLELKGYYQGVTLSELCWLNADVSRAEKELGNCPLHLRGWEWHYLKRLCRTEMRVYRQGNPLYQIHASPDGQRLAASGYIPKGGRRSSEIKIWDLHAGRLLFHHVGTQPDALGVEASADCLWVASVHENGTVDVWDTASGKKAWTVRGTRRNPGEFLAQTLFSPDGEHLATRTDANEIQLWNLKTEKLLRTLPGPGSEMTGWAFSQDGRRLVSAGYQKTGKIREATGAASHIWEVFSGNKLFTLAGAEFQPHFSPDGRLLAALGQETVKVWDLTQAEGQLVNTLQLKDSRVFGLGFSPDGQWIVTQSSPPSKHLSGEAELTVWSVKSGQALYTRRAGLGNHLRNPHFSADGQRLAANEGALVRIWQTATGQEIRTLRGHHEGINSVAFLADGRLASAGDQEIRIWDTANPQEARVVRQTAVYSVVFSPDGRLGASLSISEIKVWEAATGKVIKSWKFLAGGKIHFSGDGMRIAAVEFMKSASPKMRIKVWEATTGTELFTLQGATFDRHLAFSPDGNWIATAGGETGKPSGVLIWDALTGNQEKVLLGLDSEIKGVSFSPDSKFIAATTLRGLKAWELATGNEVFAKQLPTGRGEKSVARLLFSPDGRRLAWAGSDTKGFDLKLWDVAKGEELLARKIGSLGSVAFSPNSSLITATSPGIRPKTVHLWDVVSGKEVARLVSEQSQGQRLTFNPKGDRIAITTADGRVTLWDAATHQQLFALRGHTDVITDLKFSPDGHRIATASQDWTVRIWDATPLK